MGRLPRLLVAGVLLVAIGEPLLAAGSRFPPLPGAEPSGLSAPAETAPRESSRARGALVELDGTGSADPDGDLLDYRWRQVGGPPVTLSDPASAQPSFRTTVPGRFVFELVVSDGRRESAPARVVATVDRINIPPEALARAELTAEIDTVVTLDGSPSRDADGDVLSFRWRQIGGPPLHLRDELLASPVVAFRPAQAGIYEFELVVEDGRDRSAPHRTRVVVRPENRGPVARATVAHEPVLDPPPGTLDRVLPDAVLIARIAAEEVGTVGVPVVLDGTESRGPAGGELEYYWKQRSGPFVRVFDRPTPGRLVFEPAEAGEYVFELVVADGIHESPPARTRVAVQAGNAPPVAVVSPPESATLGEIVRLDGSGSFDPEGGPLSFHWEQTEGPRILRYVMTDPRGSAVPGFVPREPGTYGFRLVVSDGTRRSEPARCTISVAATNRPPLARVAGDLAVAPGETAVLQGRGTDPDGDRLECAWRQVGGPPLLDAPARQETLAITPTAPGTYLFAFSVFDGTIASEPVRTRVVCRPAGQEILDAPELFDLESGWLAPAGAGSPPETPASAPPVREAERRGRDFPSFPEPELETTPPARRLLGRL